MSNPYYTQPQGYPQAPAPAPVPVPPQYAPQAPPQYAPPAPQQYAPPAPPAYGAPQGPGPYGQPPGYGYGAPAPAYGQPAPYGAPPQAPTVHGSMDAFGSQPTGGGPGISFKDAPFGTTYTMTVKRDARDADVIQDRQPANQGGAPKVRRDGSPQWVLTVPVFVPPAPVYQGGQAYPEGEATLYVRSGIRDALVDAYGGNVEPKAGDQITLTLTERKSVPGQGIPKNIFRAQVLRNGQPIVAGQPAPPSPTAQAPAVNPGPQWQAPQAPQYQEPAPQYQEPAPQAQTYPNPSGQAGYQAQAQVPQGPPAGQQQAYAAGPDQSAQQAPPQYQPQAPQYQAPQAPPVQPQAPAQAVPGPVGGLPPMDAAQLALVERLRQSAQGQA